MEIDKKVEEKVEEKVVSIFAKAKSVDNLDHKKVNTSPHESLETNFDEIMRKNKQSKERMRNDRSKANRSVLKSFRIK
jgi:hypothetical protein